ncbi:hypothetical protein [Arthrobacter sp.]|uniref:hypothetical protein n=1 Tax=Arthrobacter sp. TaxID=1667 RepID=UPI0033907F2B
MTADPRGGWQGLVRRTPLWILVLVFAVVWAALQLGMRLLRGKEIAPEDVPIYGVSGVITGILMLVVTRWVLRRERKQPPGSPTATNIKRAIATGRLPEHATAERWVLELNKIIRQERHMMWIGPLVFGLFTAMGIFLVFGDPEHPWFGVLLTPLFLGIAIWYPVWIPRRRRTIQALIDQFPQEEPVRR